MNDDNLIKNEDLTPSERRERASKAGKASGQKRRERKELREELLLLLEDGDTQQRLCTALLQKAFDGDVRAFEMIRDTIGEKPIDKKEINTLPPIALVQFDGTPDEHREEIEALEKHQPVINIDIPKNAPVIIDDIV